MSDHKKGFARWYKKLPPKTLYLVEQVLTRLLPVFQEKGYCWYSDFADGDASQIGVNHIPLQMRIGKEWPTVVFQFDNRFRPFFAINFTLIGSNCKRLDVKSGDFIDVAQHAASLVDAPIYFTLCLSLRGLCGFGRTGFFLYNFVSKRFLDREIDKAINLLPVIFEVLEKGYPDSWLKFGKYGMVSNHIWIAASLYHQKYLDSLKA